MMDIHIIQCCDSRFDYNIHIIPCLLINFKYGIISLQIFEDINNKYMIRNRLGKQLLTNKRSETHC